MTAKKKRKERAESAKAKLLAQYIDGTDSLKVVRVYRQRFFLIYPRQGKQWPVNAVDIIIGMAGIWEIQAEFLFHENVIRIWWGEK